MDNLILKSFSDIELSDPFFDSLRNNYEGFDEWFKRKAQSGVKALVYYDENRLKDFLYMKEESEELLVEGNSLPAKRRLKVGTFKIERRSTNRGERFMKRILDTAIQHDFQEVYVTMFDDTEELMHLRHFFEKYGFIEIGRKPHANGRSESVLLRNMAKYSNDITTDYPFVNRLSGNKYLLSIKPEYHTKLFPDSILKTENYNTLRDESPTNSINKVYISWMKDLRNLKHGDHVIIYRTTDRPGQAAYRSVASSVCTIFEVKTMSDFADVDEFIRYSNRYSVFEESDLRRWYQKKPNFIVIKMLYNIAFQNKVIRKNIIEQVTISSDDYWGFMPLTNEQFNKILTLGNADGRYIIN